MRSDVEQCAEQLRAQRAPFVLATVVRAERPTSAKPGARAVIAADGTMTGFVGGECAQASVRAHALTCLQTREPVLLRIVPDADPAALPAQQGAVSVHNPCSSGGTLEIFLEPNLPTRAVVVIGGESPIASAFADLAAFLGYDVTSGSMPDPLPPNVAAVVVASHGADEPAALEAAVRAGVPYVGLVASRRRGPEVLAALDLDGAQQARIHTPAGLDLGARVPSDVAVSIMAEIIATSQAEIADGEPSPPPSVVMARDPVCGMTVAAVEASLQADVDGVRVWFCGPGCRDAFVAAPASFAGR